MTIPTFERPLKVIQWTTGNIGRRSLPAILSRPDLELAGVFAHGADKVGKDAAELCGWPRPDQVEPTGITATDDIEALLAIGALGSHVEPPKPLATATSSRSSACPTCAPCCTACRRPTGPSRASWVSG